MKNPEQLWVVSSSPHDHSGASVRKVMMSVILSLIPAGAAAMWLFGWDAFRLMAVCVLACVCSEALARKLMKRDSGITDLSAVVTGILLAYNLPPSLPSWMAVAGSVVAIIIAKQVFGGIGYNVFNPALIGRIFLLIAFPVQMTTWSQWHIPCPAPGVDAVTSATPLGLVKTAFQMGHPVPFEFNSDTAWSFFIGLRNGSIGEVSILALLIGATYLLWRRSIYWQIPAFYIGTVALFSGIMWVVDPTQNLCPCFHLLSGSLILGAFFMATDMVTTPVTKTGMILFGIGCGVLTMVIRKWGGYPEGVSFSIVLMNAITPLLNRATKPRVFGHGMKKQVQKL